MAAETARAALRKFIPNDPEAEPLQRVLGLCLLCTAALWGGAQRRQVKGSGCRCVSESELLRPEKTKPRFHAPRFAAPLHCLRIPDPVPAWQEQELRR